LESIVIPESVTSIGQGAFLYCKNLTEIVSYNSSNPTTGSVVGLGNFFDSDNDGYYFYDEDEEDYIYYDEDEEAEEILAETITIKEITVPETSSDGTSENSSSENSSYDSQVGILVDDIKVAKDDEGKYYATFDVKIDTNHYGGEGGVYLNKVCVILNDLSDGTTADKAYQITECYEEDGYVIFPVKLSASNIANVAIRGEVYAGSEFGVNDGPYYYASTAKYMSSYVNEETA
jgi:hypothetical protein